MLSQHQIFPNLNHSFLAWMSRDELRLDGKASGHYKELLLHSITDPESRKKLLREKVAEALGETESTSQSLLEIARDFGPFVDLLNGLIAMVAGGKIS